MAAPQVEPEKLIAELKSRAQTLGFGAFGIARADSRPDLPGKLAHPRRLWDEARSVILLGVNYGPAADPMSLLGEKNTGIISAYARNRDYHDIIKGRLKELAGLLARRAGTGVKVFVDTAPLMEKPLAEAAGLGWQGKHSVLVSRQFGSWLFLGAILTSAELPVDQPGSESCGTCTKCLDVCPTNAFPAPFRLDARKCLAYYSVEHKGPIPRQFRRPMGNRVYGCDDCLAVCPWNKFATVSREARLRSRPEFERPALADLVQLDDAAFRELFAGSPVKRIGVSRFLRNVLICIGNSGDVQHLDEIVARLDDASPLVRGAAVWALRRLDPHLADTVRQDRMARESDAAVRAEWDGVV